MKGTTRYNSPDSICYLFFGDFLLLCLLQTLLRNGNVAHDATLDFELTNIGKENFQHFDIAPPVLMDRFTLTITEVYGSINNGFGEIRICPAEPEGGSSLSKLIQSGELSMVNSTV